MKRRDFLCGMVAGGAAGVLAACRSRGAAGAALSASAAASASAASLHAEGLICSPEADWPQWRGRWRDGISDETHLLGSWPAGGPKLLWKATGMERGWSSPIIVSGTIFLTGDVGHELRIFALNLDGKEKWRAVNGAAWKRSWPGARACCAYSDGRVYNMNAHGRVACFDAASGRELWAVNVMQRFAGHEITWGISECLLIDGPRVIVTPGGRKCMMAALDKATGRTVWTSPPLDGDRAGYASPILFRRGRRRVLASCSSRHAFAVDAGTGKLLWAQPRPTLYQVIVTTPVWGGESTGLLYVTSPDGRQAGLLALGLAGDGSSARPRWRSPLNTLCGGLVLVRGRLYGGGYERNDHWFCVDAATGKTLYQKRDLHAGAAIWADGRLYALSQRGRMVLWKPTPTDLETMGRFTLVPGRHSDVWAHPVICAGRLYLRYHDTLWCYDVRGRSTEPGNQ